MTDKNDDDKIQQEKDYEASEKIAADVSADDMIRQTPKRDFDPADPNDSSSRDVGTIGDDNLSTNSTPPPPVGDVEKNPNNENT